MCKRLTCASSPLELSDTRSQEAAAMRPRHADILKDLDCEASVEEFRRTLAEIKAEHFPQFTDEELTFTRDEAGTYSSNLGSVLPDSHGLPGTRRGARGAEEGREFASDRRLLGQHHPHQATPPVCQGAPTVDFCLSALYQFLTFCTQYKVHPGAPERPGPLGTQDPDEPRSFAG
jgi:hypothetical protein